MKPEDLQEMPHVLVEQSCSRQTKTISQGKWKDTNDQAAESDIEDQVIDEECTGKTEWIFVFENILTFENLSLRLLSSFDVAF